MKKMWSGCRDNETVWSDAGGRRYLIRVSSRKMAILFSAKHFGERFREFGVRNGWARQAEV